MSSITKLAQMWLTRSFRPFRFTNEYDQELEYKDEKCLGLYVHIPFCRSICAFCPYCKTIYRPELADQYVRALLREIELVGKTLDGARIEVTSLYFGGGTPALLAEGIALIVAQLKKYFVITEGIGVELHPQDVTEDQLQILKQAGVTKISIGVQSFQGEFLEILGRRQLLTEEMFTALSKVSFETVSMDFIFALPGQTIEHLKADIELAFQHGANHVAVYPFIDFTFTDRRFPPMPESKKRELLYQFVRYCEEKGYVRDSIWTFSKEGTSKYSSMTRDNFLGFGCSATTLLKDQFKINTFDVDQYMARIKGSQLPTALTLKFTLRQRMVYYLFWTTYTMRVDINGFYHFFERPLKKYYGFELSIAQLLGWVRKDHDGYIMTTKGSYYFHYFEHFYTLSYIDQMWHLMKHTAFPQELVIR